VAGPSILAAQAGFLDRQSRWPRKPFAYLQTVEFSPRYAQHTNLLLAAGRVHGAWPGIGAWVAIRSEAD
jgi:hypothetical protein